jgi:UDPglucose--hexose-1-phosphate uridylyltransferase
LSDRRLDLATREWTGFAAPGASGCDLCDVVAETQLDGGVLVLPSADGATERVVYGSEHGSTLAGLDLPALRLQIEVWADRYRELGARDGVRYVLVSEDAGGDAHPHVRIDAYAEPPARPQRQLDVGAAHLREHGTCAICDGVGHESADGTRVVAGNRSFLAHVPYAARLPYELHVTARRHATSLLDLTDVERDAFAELLREALGRVADCTGGAPYALALHQVPTDDGEWLAVSHFRAEIFPLPARASGTGIAAGAWVNTLLPERAAAELRAAVP